MFFCCDVCLTQFRRLVARIEAETGWPTIDALEIEGDRRGRRCTASYGSQSYRATVAFNAQGEIRAFANLP